MSIKNQVGETHCDLPTNVGDGSASPLQRRATLRKMSRTTHAQPD